MLKRLLGLDSRLATGRNILVLLSLFLLANLVVIPATYPKFQTLDTLWSYTPGKAYDLISSYGAEGRQFYAVIELTLDLIYPFITALLFSLAILYTFKRAFPGSGWVLYLSLTPYAIMLADYFENACVVAMLLSYPHELTDVARISSVFTTAKFVLAPLQLLFVVGLVGWAVRAIRKRHPG